MISFALWKFKVAGLQILRFISYIISVPFLAVFAVFGSYFVVIALAWIMLIGAAAIAALLIFEANFFMAFVALFNESVWTSMGNMWTWLWTWFADGNIGLWPHIIESFFPYFLVGVVLMLLHYFTSNLKSKAIAIQQSNLV